MIALEHMRRVDSERLEIPSLKNWSWIPDVKDLDALEDRLSTGDATILTSRSTFTQSVDHGEHY